MNNLEDFFNPAYLQVPEPDEGPRRRPTRRGPSKNDRLKERFQSLIAALESGNSCPSINIEGSYSSSKFDRNDASIIASHIPHCSLISLSINWNCLEDDSFAEIISSACRSTTITTLQIYRSTINLLNVSPLIQLILTNRLTHLDLTSINSDVMTDIVRAISVCHSIEQLTLANCEMDGSFTSWIIDIISSNPNLKVLDISGNPIRECLKDIGLALANNESIECFRAIRTSSSLVTCRQFVENIRENFTLTDTEIDQLEPDNLEMPNPMEELDQDELELPNPFPELVQLMKRNKDLVSQRRFKITKGIVFGGF